MQEAVNRMSEDMNRAASEGMQGYRDLHATLDREMERASNIREVPRGLSFTQQQQQATEHVREQYHMDMAECQRVQGHPATRDQEHAFRQRAERDLADLQGAIADSARRQQARQQGLVRQQGYVRQQDRWGVVSNDQGYYYQNIQFDDTMRVPSGQWYSADGCSDWEEMQKKKQDAEHKAQELLSHLIGKDLLTVYKETGRLFVKGKEYDYIIPRDGFITKIGKDKVYDMCVHLERKASMPETDNVIAMKLFLEGNEKEALKLANIHGTHDKKRYALPACAGMEN
jgi:hypothetical protein